MFCHKCGFKLPDDAVFCSKCGTKLLSVPMSEPQEQVKPPIRPQEQPGPMIVPPQPPKPTSEAQKPQTDNLTPLQMLQAKQREREANTLISKRAILLLALSIGAILLIWLIASFDGACTDCGKPIFGEAYEISGFSSEERVLCEDCANEYFYGYR